MQSQDYVDAVEYELNNRPAELWTGLALGTHLPDTLRSHRRTERPRRTCHSPPTCHWQTVIVVLDGWQPNREGYQLLEESERTLITEIFSRLASLEGQGELVTTIVTTLGQEIIEGTLEAGFELTSVNLSKRFQTSRTPVREALAILQREGLVDIQMRRRPRVSAISEKEIRDLYAVRASLYSLVSQEIIRNTSDDDINLLCAPLAVMEEAVADNDVTNYFARSVEFRHIESRICQNDAVEAIIDSLGLRVYRLRRFGLSLPGRMQTSLEDHRRLYEAYVERDEQFACAITKALVSRALREIEKNVHQLGGSVP